MFHGWPAPFASLSARCLVLTGLLFNTSKSGASHFFPPRSGKNVALLRTAATPCIRSLLGVQAAGLTSHMANSVNYQLIFCALLSLPEDSYEKSA